MCKICHGQKISMLCYAIRGVSYKKHTLREGNTFTPQFLHIQSDFGRYFTSLQSAVFAARQQ